MNHVILEYLSREAAYMRLAGQEQTDGNKGGMKQWGKQQSAVQTGSGPAPAGAPADRYYQPWGGTGWCVQSIIMLLLVGKYHLLYLSLSSQLTHL
jgi:hypothetical protein